MSELLPCPFCGSSHIEVNCFCVSWVVCCKSCGLQFNRGEQYKDSIIAAWNQRSQQPATGATASTNKLKAEIAEWIDIFEQHEAIAVDGWAFRFWKRMNAVLAQLSAI